MPTTYNYMTATTLQNFAEALLTGINNRIENGYMVQSVGVNPDFADAATDAYRVPSVAAVKTALRAVAGAHLKIQQVVGVWGANETYATLTALVTGVTGAAPRTDTIYLQKDGASDNTWTMYIYTTPVSGDPVWIDIGNTDLSFSAIEGRLDALETTVGDANSGLVKKVADLENDLDPSTANSTGAQVAANTTAIGDASSGLVKRVNDIEADLDASESGSLAAQVAANTTAIGDASSGLVKDVADLDTNKVNVSDMAALSLGTIVSDALAATPISSGTSSGSGE